MTNFIISCSEESGVPVQIALFLSTINSSLIFFVYSLEADLKQLYIYIVFLEHIER